MAQLFRVLGLCGQHLNFLRPDRVPRPRQLYANLSEQGVYDSTVIDPLLTSISLI